jgi:hypothetical protein
MRDQDGDQGLLTCRRVDGLLAFLLAEANDKLHCRWRNDPHYFDLDKVLGEDDLF